MMIIPDKSIRKYVAVENGVWIHDPQMPKELEEEFQKFVLIVNGNEKKNVDENKGK